MIPIDLQAAQSAFNDKKINVWELTFLNDIHAQDYISEKQHETFELIGNKMLPYKIVDMTKVTPRHNEYQMPIDPYFNESYYK